MRTRKILQEHLYAMSSFMYFSSCLDFNSPFCAKVSAESANQFGELVADPVTNELLHYTEKPETFVCKIYIILLNVFFSIWYCLIPITDFLCSFLLLVIFFYSDVI